MDHEGNKNISVFFSKESPFPPETYSKLEALFKSNEGKHLSIQKGGKILIKMHEDVLKEDFPETIVMFESNNQVVSLPEDLDAEYLELLVKYFYLREVLPAISISQSINLLNLAVFFKAHSLTKEIQEFLLGNANKNENALEIFKNSLEQNLDLEDFDIDNIPNYLEKLDIEGNNVVFRAMSKKITLCKREIKELKEKMSILENKVRDFEGETKKSEEKIRLNFEGKLMALEEKLLKEEKIQNNSIFELSKFTFAPSNNGALSLSNSNTTVEKISGDGYFDGGIQCDISSMIRASDKLLFSLRIEKTKYAFIVYGFCIKNHDFIADESYHSSKYSFMLQLDSGNLYSRSNSIKGYIQEQLLIGPAQANQIFSASFDYKLKTISFYLNGALLGYPFQTYLNKEDAELMCPCVDLYHEGDRVSLVIQEVFN